MQEQAGSSPPIREKVTADGSTQVAVPGAGPDAVPGAGPVHGQVQGQVQGQLLCQVQGRVGFSNSNKAATLLILDTGN